MFNRSVVWIAPSFGSPCPFDRSVALRRLDRPVVWIAQSFGSLRRLDRSVIWIALTFGSLCPFFLDRSAVWISTSLFESPHCLDRPVVWFAPFFGSLRRLDRPVIWIAPLRSVGCIAPSFGSLRHVDCSVVWIVPRRRRSVVWIAPSFGSHSLGGSPYLVIPESAIQYGDYHRVCSDVIIPDATSSAAGRWVCGLVGEDGRRRCLDHPVVVWLALSFGSLIIAPLFGSPDRLDRSVVWIAPLRTVDGLRLDCPVVWIAL